MPLPKRKNTRLREYDYSTPGAYFVTVCTKGRECTLGQVVVGDGDFDVPYVALSEKGRILDKYIKLMCDKYDYLHIDEYIIMPNHFHFLITIDSEESIKNGTSQAPSPTNAVIPKTISLLKRMCNREYGENFFQRSFHDHIIRDNEDYLKIKQYIRFNAQKWETDCFYKK